MEVPFFRPPRPTRDDIVFQTFLDRIDNARTVGEHIAIAHDIDIEYADQGSDAEEVLLKQIADMDKGIRTMNRRSVLLARIRRPLPEPDDVLHKLVREIRKLATW